MFCNNCGKEIAEGATFCNTCGTPLNGQPAQQKHTDPKCTACGYEVRGS